MKALQPARESAHPPPPDAHHLGEPEVLIRQHQVLELYAPVCRVTWWRWVKEGRAPQPVRLGPRMLAWRKSDIIAWQQQQGWL